MLIAVSGAQGVGKTTLLNELAMLDYTVDPYKVSRSVQKELGLLSLSEIYNSFETMKAFQTRVIHNKLNHDRRLKEDNVDDIVFVERSFNDILAYTELHIDKLTGPKVPMNLWLDGYSLACNNYQDELYDAVILIEPNGNIKFEQDKNRAEEDTQLRIADRLLELSLFSNNNGTLIISEADINKRIKIVIDFVEKLK